MSSFGAIGREGESAVRKLSRGSVAAVGAGISSSLWWVEISIAPAILVTTSSADRILFISDPSSANSSAEDNIEATSFAPVPNESLSASSEASLSTA